MMLLTSSAFADGTAIPKRFTCDGEDVSPPLAWSNVPSGVRSFVLQCDDPDAPAGIWHHWAIYDIPPDCTALPEDADRHPAAVGFSQAVNDFRTAGYGGPCPPPRHGIHHYRFRLVALSVAALPVRGTPTCPAVVREAQKHAVAEATLTGTYQR